jgi:rhodanese-related sulfurtransferase
MSPLNGPDFLERAEAARRQIREVDAAGLQSLLDSGAHLIDVRDPQEYVAGHIPGAQQINGSVLPLQASELLPEREKPVVLVCSGGNRSAIAALELQNLGYTTVVSLRGGLRQWREPLERQLPTPA